MPASLFDLTQWKFWNHKTQQPEPHSLEIRNTLENAMKLSPNHPGANHLYVHFMDATPFPQDAIKNANLLPQLVPGSEHMNHMPCHIYYLLGQYHQSTLVNQKAIQVWQDYLGECKRQGFEPVVQYLAYHNYDYLVASAYMEGRKELAMTTAKELASKSKTLIENNVLLQKWLTPSLLALARFGEWDKIRQYPQPDSKYQYVTAIWYYVQALADLEANQIDAAKSKLDKLKAIIQKGPSDANSGPRGIELMKLSQMILEGLLAHKAQDESLMVDKFKQAIQLEDTFLHSDPPAWYFPVRELLAKALLNNDQYQEAKSVFLQDLKQHPQSGWSLYGLAEVYDRLGEKENAKQVRQQFKQAWQRADIPKPVYLIK